MQTFEQSILIAGIQNLAVFHEQKRIWELTVTLFPAKALAVRKHDTKEDIPAVFFGDVNTSDERRFD